MKKKLTPKMLVLRLYPTAKCKWVPGWSLYKIECPGSVTLHHTGFTSQDAWKTLAINLKLLKT